MEKERFKELALDYSRWVKQSCRNKFVGDTLLPIIDKAYVKHSSDVKGFEEQSNAFINNIQNWGALSEARALYYGLAIENACKARLIFDGVVESDGDKIIHLRTDHDIEGMVRQLGVSSPPDEPEFLKLLTYQTQVLSKYPIAKNRKKQKEFTGRALGARPIEGLITHDIIFQILRHKELQDLYKKYSEI